jgi:hypothetical protein
MLVARPSPRGDGWQSANERMTTSCGVIAREYNGRAQRENVRPGDGLETLRRSTATIVDSNALSLGPEKWISWKLDHERMLMPSNCSIVARWLRANSNTRQPCKNHGLRVRDAYNYLFTTRYVSKFKRSTRPIELSTRSSIQLLRRTASP